jgi:hypothetical protein
MENDTFDIGAVRIQCEDFEEFELWGFFLHDS